MIASILSYLEKHTYLLYAALALLTIITLLLTLLPSEQLIDARVFRYDKLGHMLMFGSWTFLLGLIQLVSNRKPLPLFTIFIAGSLFGITVEILQEVLPVDRSMDPYDALADIVGCLIAVLVLKVITFFSSYDNNPLEQ
jgi:VanZ family protein